MLIHCIYIPVLFDESTWIKFDSHNHTIISIFWTLFQRYPGTREDSPCFTIRVNGKKVTDPLKWKEELKDGDEVVIIQEIGIEWILGVLFPGVLTFLGITMATWATIIYVVIVIAYVIYSYCSAPKAPKYNAGNRSSLNDSPTYGWDGLQMQYRQGVPVPIVYGEHLIGGNLIECYITSVDDKNYLNMLIALSEGEIEGIMKADLSDVCDSTSDAPYILINDNPIANFQDIEWDYRLGTQDQTQIPGFGDVCQTYPVGAVKITPTPYTYTTVDSDIEAFELRFRVPSMYTQVQNDFLVRTITAHIEHRIHGAGGYTDDGTFTITHASFENVRRFFRLDDLAPGQYDVRITLTSSEPVPPNTVGDLFLDSVIEVKYDTLSYPHTALVALTVLATEQLSGTLPNVLTRIRGIKSKNLDTEAIKWTKNPIYNVNNLLVTSRYGLGNYISSGNVNHDQLILMAEHCDQILGNGIEGIIDDVDATSLTCSDWTFTASDIGKSVCSICPTNGVIYTHLVITSLTGDHKVNGTSWSNGIPTGIYWEFGETRYELDIVIDSQNAALDCVQQVCGSFRGIPIWNKDSIQVLIDKAESPCYIFNMGNIIEGSFKHSFSSEKSKPNCLQVDYADKDRFYQKETVDVTDFAAITGSVPKRTRSLSLIGAVRQSQVYREARFHLYAPKYQDEQISFKGAIDAIHMLPGDVVKFQHDVFAWGQGGRIVSAADTTHVTLDQPVTVAATKTYVLTCKLTNDTLETRTMDLTVGTYTVKTVTINDGGHNYSINDVLTIVQGGASGCTYKVTSVAAGVVDGVELVTVGTGYTIANALVTTVLPNVGTGCKLNITEMTISTITVTVAYTTTPPTYGLYAFGETSIESKPFRIMNVSKTSENEIEVTATEYSESVYVDTNIVLVEREFSALPPSGQWPSGPDPVNPLLLPPDVTDFTLTELTDITGVQITFTRPATTTTWDHAQLFVSNDGGANYINVVLVNTADPIKYYDVLAGYTYYFKIVSYSALNVQSASPPIQYLTMSGVAAHVPTTLATTAGFQNILLVWTNVADVNLVYTEVWRASTNDRAGAVKIGIVYAPGNSFVDELKLTAVTRYYWVIAKVRNGGYSSWYPTSATGGVSGTTGALDSTDIVDFSITASKIFTKIPILSGDSWTNNSPGAGQIAWNAHTLYYNGAAYAISASNTALKYIYWLNGGTSYTASDNNPTLTDGDFIIATNTSGTHDLAWNAIANQVIGSAYIQDGSILNAKIGNATIETLKLIQGVVTDVKILNHTVNEGSATASGTWSGMSGQVSLHVHGSESSPAKGLGAWTVANPTGIDGPFQTLISIWFLVDLTCTGPATINVCKIIMSLLSDGLPTQQVLLSTSLMNQVCYMPVVITASLQKNTTYRLGWDIEGWAVSIGGAGDYSIKLKAGIGSAMVLTLLR